VLGYAIGDFLLADQRWPTLVPQAAPGVVGDAPGLSRSAPAAAADRLPAPAGGRRAHPAAGETLLGTPCAAWRGGCPIGAAGAQGGHACDRHRRAGVAWGPRAPGLNPASLHVIGALAPPGLRLPPAPGSGRPGDRGGGGGLAAQDAEPVSARAAPRHPEAVRRAQAPVISLAERSRRPVDPPLAARCRRRHHHGAAGQRDLANLPEAVILVGGTFRSTRRVRGW